MTKKLFTAVLAAIAACFLSFAAIIGINAAAEETKIYIWPNDYIVRKSAWQGANEVALAVESNDQTVWAAGTKTITDSVDRSKITYTRGNATETPYRVIYDGKGLHYLFNGSAISGLGNTPLNGDKFEIAKDFTFTLHENKDNTAPGYEKWSNRTYTYGKTMSYTYENGVWKSNNFAVTFDVDGVKTVVEVAGGEIVDAPAEKPVKQGYEFIGWKVNGAFYDFSAPVAEDMTLTAYFIGKDDLITSGALLITNAELREKLGATAFEWEKSRDNAVILHNDDKVYKGLNLNVLADKDYHENAGTGIGGYSDYDKTTICYQTYGYGEVYYSGNNGMVNGFEGALSGLAEVKSVPVLTMEAGFYPQDGAKEFFRDGDGKPHKFSAWLYAYGLDESGRTIQSKAYAGEISAGSFTTLRADFSDSGIKYIERFAVVIDFKTALESFSDARNKTGKSDLFYLANIKFSAEEAVTDEKILTANDDDVYFFDGGCLTGYLGDDYASAKVFRSNGASVAVGGVATTDYKYSTMRISAGRFVTLCLREPIKASDYTYLDMETLAWAQIADGGYREETASAYYLKALKYNAADTSDGESVTLSKRKWGKFRIPLEKFADENGYVSKIIILYEKTSENRTAEEEKYYSINLMFHNFTLTSFVEEEAIFTYIESPTLEEPTSANPNGRVLFRLKSSVEIPASKVNDDLLNSIVINDHKLKRLMQNSAADCRVDGNFLTIITVPTVFDPYGNNEIIIKGGATIVDYGGGKKLRTVDDETFVYDGKLMRFDLLPDFDEVKKKSGYVGIEVVEMSVSQSTDPNDPTKTPLDGFQSKDDKFKSIWVTFNGPANNLPIGQMQSSLEDQMTGRKQSATSELVNYGLARNGAFYSATDKLLVNGKSIREWMQIDYENGDGELIRIAYLGFNLNGGKHMAINVAESSALAKTMGVGKAMSVEFKAGFTTPTLLRIDRDMKFEITAENAKGNQSRFDDVTERREYEPDQPDGSQGGQSKGGCAGGVTDCAAVAITLVFAVAVVIARGRKSENE